MSSFFILSVFCFFEVFFFFGCVWFASTSKLFRERKETVFPPLPFVPSSSYSRMVTKLLVRNKFMYNPTFAS